MQGFKTAVSPVTGLLQPLLAPLLLLQKNARNDSKVGTVEFDSFRLSLFFRQARSGRKKALLQEIKQGLMLYILLPAIQTSHLIFHGLHLYYPHEFAPLMPE